MEVGGQEEQGLIMAEGGGPQPKGQVVFEEAETSLEGGQVSTAGVERGADLWMFLGRSCCHLQSD